MSDPIELQKELIELVKVSYPDLLKPSFREIGFGLGTIIEFLGIPLLRLKLMNVKAKLRFRQRLDKLIAELDLIPSSDRTEIPSSIASPALEQLSVETDEDISDLYIALLRKAASLSEGPSIHPSFVNVLRNLCNDEAKLIEYFRDKGDIPFLIARLQFNETEGIDRTSILTGIETHVKFNSVKNVPLYFGNLVGLGILSKEIGSLSDTERWYKPLFQIYEPLRAEIYNAGHTDGKKYNVAFIASYYRITPYGKLFIEACLKKLPGSENG
jgi:hypothetical protein